MRWFSQTLLNPAGGLRYHLRALNHSRTLWEPFRREVGDWLEKNWAPSRDTLLILGPSGGYCMNWHWLRRFSRVVAVDPDPLAHFIFKRKMRKAGVYAQLHWVAGNPFAQGAKKLQELLKQESGAAILFSNLIGQLPLVLAEPDYLNIEKQLASILAGRSWASFHDRLSGPLQPKTEAGAVFSRRPSDLELLSRYYQASQATELLDHGAEQFFPADLEHRYFDWELSPGFHHLIEGVCSR